MSRWRLLRAFPAGNLLCGVSVGSAATFVSASHPAVVHGDVTSTRRKAIPQCDTSMASPWKPFKPDFRGQITPRRSLPVMTTCEADLSLELQGGPFGSRWIRFRHGDLDVAKTLATVADAEVGAKSAVWLGIPDDHAYADKLLPELRQRGYKFHHASTNTDSKDPEVELFYYRWLGDGSDMVPSYTTAHEGVGVLVMSPAKDKVLLVWEYGNWKMITGNLDGCDSVFTTVAREAMEECGLELEDDLSFVGGWQDPKTYDGRWNNVFSIFVAVAKSDDISVDGKEIHKAMWFDLDSLPSVEEAAAAPQVDNAPFGMRWNTGDPERPIVSRGLPHFLTSWRQGRSLKVQRGLRGSPASENRIVYG